MTSLLKRLTDGKHAHISLSPPPPRPPLPPHNSRLPTPDSQHQLSTPPPSRSAELLGAAGNASNRLNGCLAPRSSCRNQNGQANPSRRRRSDLSAFPARTKRLRRASCWWTSQSRSRQICRSAATTTSTSKLANARTLGGRQTDRQQPSATDRHTFAAKTSTSTTRNTTRTKAGTSTTAAKGRRRSKQRRLAAAASRLPFSLLRFQRCTLA